MIVLIHIKKDKPRDGPRLNSTGYSCRRPTFDSQHTPNILQPPVISAPGLLTPSSCLPEHQAYTWHTDIYAAKIPIHMILIKEKETIEEKNKKSKTWEPRFCMVKSVCLLSGAGPEVSQTPLPPLVAAVHRFLKKDLKIKQTAVTEALCVYWESAIFLYKCFRWLQTYA